jgi:hypothetical protein
MVDVESNRLSITYRWKEMVFWYQKAGSFMATLWLTLIAPLSFGAE